MEKKKPSSDSVERMNEVIPLAQHLHPLSYQIVTETSFPNSATGILLSQWCCLVLEARISKVSRQHTQVWNCQRLAFARVDAPYRPVW